MPVKALRMSKHDGNMNECPRCHVTFRRIALTDCDSHVEGDTRGVNLARFWKAGKFFGNITTRE